MTNPYVEMPRVFLQSTVGLEHIYFTRETLTSSTSWLSCICDSQNLTHSENQKYVFSSFYLSDYRGNLTNIFQSFYTLLKIFGHSILYYCVKYLRVTCRDICATFHIMSTLQNKSYFSNWYMAGTMAVYTSLRLPRQFLVKDFRM